MGLGLPLAGRRRVCPEPETEPGSPAKPGLGVAARSNRSSGRLDPGALHSVRTPTPSGT